MELYIIHILIYSIRPRSNTKSKGLNRAQKPPDIVLISDFGCKRETGHWHQPPVKTKVKPKVNGFSPPKSKPNCMEKVESFLDEARERIKRDHENEFRQPDAEWVNLSVNQARERLSWSPKVPHASEYCHNDCGMKVLISKSQC